MAARERSVSAQRCALNVRLPCLPTAGKAQQEQPLPDHWVHKRQHTILPKLAFTELTISSPMACADAAANDI